MMEASSRNRARKPATVDYSSEDLAKNVTSLSTLDTMPLGDIRHKQERHPGQHEGIVNCEIWERVQQRLREGTARLGGSGGTAAPRSPLAGKLFDETGEPLLVQGSAKGRHRYRHYVSRKLVHGEAPEDAEYGRHYPRLRLNGWFVSPRKECLPTATRSREPVNTLAWTQSGCHSS